MKNKKKHILWVTLQITFAAMLGAILFFGLRLNPNNHKSALLNKLAYPFNLPALAPAEEPPKEITLEDFKGKPLILNFWASWCDNCRNESQHLESFWQKHRDHVAVVGIAVQDTLEDALKAAKELGKTYPLALDEPGNSGIYYGVTGVPETFFIDKEGIVRAKITGPSNAALLEEKLSTIMP